MNREGFRAYLDYHYPPSPEACWGGNQHIWVDTGVARYTWAGVSTGSVPSEGTPKEKEQRCFCGATQWVHDQ